MSLTDCSNLEKNELLTFDHLFARMRVDDLISESTEGEVRSLRNVGKLGSRRFRNSSPWRVQNQSVDGSKVGPFRHTVDRPETTKDSEER